MPMPTPGSAADLLDRALRFKEPIMIRGDRLLLALEVTAFSLRDRASVERLPNPRGLSLDRVFQMTRNRAGSGNTFPPSVPIYQGIHRGGESVGLAVLHTALEHAHGLEKVRFCWTDILYAFLSEWIVCAPEHELHGLTCWIAQIAAGELTEADFKKTE